jgi:1,2-diacylglycerol 3-alpha-glucosyltransferase
VKRRVTIITEIISPYRIPLFNALAKSPVVDLHVIFLAETDPQLRQWHVYKNEIAFAYEVLPSFRKRIGKLNLLLNRGLISALQRAAPHAIVCGGYNYLASWRALRWARTHRVPFLLWSESNLHDLRGAHRFVDFLKKRFLRQCSGFVVPGLAAREYLRAQGVSNHAIFEAPNAVDNVFFATAAGEARHSPEAMRSSLDLPERYFLFAGRLVREKGVFDLLAAYAELEEALRHRIGLVLAGDGQIRLPLEERARLISPGNIKFAGFAHREQLPAYYGLAEALILPTYTDTWGLVVNEAMACGLPVIVSRAAGCVADLVEDGVNGLLIPPKDTSSLVAAMRKLAGDHGLRTAMGANSFKRIAHYSPQAWADGIVSAVAEAGVERG